MSRFLWIGRLCCFLLQILHGDLLPRAKTRQQHYQPSYTHMHTHWLHILKAPQWWNRWNHCSCSCKLGYPPGTCVVVCVCVCVHLCVQVHMHTCMFEMCWLLKHVQNTNTAVIKWWKHVKQAQLQSALFHPNSPQNCCLWCPFLSPLFSLLLGRLFFCCFLKCFKLD